MPRSGPRSVRKYSDEFKLTMTPQDRALRRAPLPEMIVNFQGNLISPGISEQGTSQLP